MTSELQETLSELAERHDVPGAAAGILADGAVSTAFYGVTSVDNPLPVDRSTLFQFGSTGKTFTATALLRLVEQGQVDLDRPVRIYLPELRLRDEEAAAQVTVMHLLNHTAGWSGDLFVDTGSGDDALARYVEAMADLEQISPLGSAVSYNNAAFCLAGRVIERVTGETYEGAMRRLVLDPLGLRDTVFDAVEIMVRRFSVGHERHADGTTTVCRPWAMPRSANPAGGMSATVDDQLRWAKFHLGDGTAPDGTRILSSDLLARMREPTAQMTGGSLGDAVGISWLLRDVDGTRLVGHGGTTHGQYSSFVTVPARGFAVTCMTNCGPGGTLLNRELVRWALEHHLGVIDPEPVPVELPADALAAYAGLFETIMSTIDVGIRDGGLVAASIPKPEAMAAIRDRDQEAEPQPPILIGLLGDGDAFIVPDGPGKGTRGFFTRAGDGTVDGLHIGGRLARRIPAVVR